MGKKVAAGFVIFRLSKTIEYLLLQTSYGINHWTPPKGHVDPGETDVMVTAFRETLEESGLHEEDLEIYKDCKKILNYQVNGKPKEVHYFLAKLVNPKAEVKLSNEHQDFKWLEIGEACRIVGYEDMQSTLKEFNEYIIKTNNNLSK
ncbi:bis(5'-nucleosyl)-tetraphosphatase [asymmetrical] [Diorhabda carinulata]|uniref:bis(5'-nucleosyl)-tetraphosphatase [asymmetrical] n=1 Tax=Diorhabda carinulata TaxID=1163345 RepID=UPI0025A1E322|nr:bis(5'-nucleosyl)-tetraphosphatase [asymmetrical] [Diorhabda carinulata]